MTGYAYLECFRVFDSLVAVHHVDFHAFDIFIVINVWKLYLLVFIITYIEIWVVNVIFAYTINQIV